MPWGGQLLKVGGSTKKHETGVGHKEEQIYKTENLEHPPKEIVGGGANILEEEFHAEGVDTREGQKR